MSRAERRQRVEIALQAVGLADRAAALPAAALRRPGAARRHRPSDRRRIRRSSWPTSRPAISIPTRRPQILDLLQRLNRELGTTLLMVTHDAEAAAVAGRQLRLDHGKLRDGRPATAPVTARAER